LDTQAFLNYLQSQPTFAGQMAHVEHIRARRAEYADLERPLAPEFLNRLQAQGLFPLYTHQAEAVNRIRAGRNVMVATSSASGKTLCYNIAVAEALLADQGSRAIYLFPTKALAQDQLRALHKIFTPDLFQVEELDTFDGDTPKGERAEIRKRARVIPVSYTHLTLPTSDLV